MKFKVFLALGIALISSFGYSQEVTQAGKDVDQIILKISKLNIVKYVTPLLLKKVFKLNSIGIE